MINFFKKKHFTVFIRTACAAMLVLGFNGVHAQPAASVPPARTYHVDKYDRETRVVKERWSEDSNGEKHGKYIAYMPNGQVKENTMYNHGAKNGPSFIFDKLVFSDGYLKYVGTYTNGLTTGIWNIYPGTSKSLERKVWFDNEGYMYQDSKYENGRLAVTYSYQNKSSNRPNGPARVYGVTSTEYASGSIVEGKYVGTWMNATMGEGGIGYKKGSKVKYDEIAGVTVIDASGTVRSLKEEARLLKEKSEQQESEQRKAEKATADDEELAGDINTGRITFNKDSYVITEDGIRTLEIIVRDVKKKSASKYKINSITLSTHSANNPQRDSTLEAERQKMMFILTVNRAYNIQAYLSKALEGIQVTSYACGSNLSVLYSDKIKRQDVYYTDEKRVQMTFDEDLPRARQVFQSMQTKYGFGSVNSIVPNEPMKNNILNIIESYYEDAIVRSEMVFAQNRFIEGKRETTRAEYLKIIPTELWLSTMTVGVPAGYAEQGKQEEFKKFVIMLFKKLNAKYQTSLGPNVLFTDELLVLSKSDS